MRFAAFWAAVIQLGLGVALSVFGISQLIQDIASLKVINVFLWIILNLLLVKAGFDGLRCTIRRVVEKGLNERLVERLIVWSWLTGLMAVMMLVLLVYNITTGEWLSILLNILFLPVYYVQAYVVWSYKEDCMVKLPDHMGSWSSATTNKFDTEQIQRSVTEPAQVQTTYDANSSPGGVYAQDDTNSSWLTKGGAEAPAWPPRNVDNPYSSNI
eukprot:TRINITY_DN12172_c0_g2_i4.p1 TRINITY_DN12172_c0_g2~~TRINITY_DN12172_c0_g2_i4.p1  ORF type:complete len:213 (-),score=28.49 TRINITY_DN12172_c0_g2_i4:166-804(-)